MKGIHIVAALVILGWLATAYFLLFANPDLRFVWWFTFWPTIMVLAFYFWVHFTGMDRLVMSPKQNKEKAWEFWQRYKAHMGEPEFEMLPGERVLMPLAPAYFPAYLFGWYKGVVVTNMRILIGFSRAGGKNEVFATSESFGKKNNLWHKDVPAVPESIGKADFTYNPFFAGLGQKLSNYDSRIMGIESGNDELGDFVTVSFTGGGSITFYTPDAKKIVEIFSKPIVK